MLNVLITNVYTTVVEKTYKTLNLPMGGEVSLVVTFQDQHARSFAKRIEGIKVGIALSHPHVA
jgi:hypothetical protein